MHKPVGMTSHDVVAQVRRLTGIRQVGHAGTLDPDAEGILPVAVGSATRLLNWLELSPKVYEGVLALGTLTATGDAAGAAVGHSGPPWPTADQMRSAARWLTGRGWQIPPRVAAIKQGGMPQYLRVRRGEAVVPAPRRVEVINLEVEAEPDPRRFRFRAAVGPGLYVRALVRDWGFLVGQAAHVARLERVQVGRMGRGQAIALDALVASGSDWVRALLSPLPYLAIPVVEVGPRRAAEIRHGHIGPWGELWGRRGPVALVAAGEVLAVAEGPPWRYRAVLWTGR